MTRTISILVHGPSKAGKSTLSATAPKPLLYIDIEGGTRFLPLRAKYWEPLREPPPECDSTWDTAVVVVRDYEEVKQAYDWLASGNHCFEAVVIDSVSELQQRLVDKITARLQATQQDWGDVFRQFMGLIRDFHQLTTHPTRPISAVFVAMSKEGQDGIFRPFLQGQSKANLPYVMDIMGAMLIETGVDSEGVMWKSHQLVTGPHKSYETGERVNGRIPATLPNPTIPLILDYIFGVEPSAAPIPVAAPNTSAPAEATQ